MCVICHFGVSKVSIDFLGCQLFVYQLLVGFQLGVCQVSAVDCLGCQLGVYQLSVGFQLGVCQVSI